MNNPKISLVGLPPEGRYLCLILDIDLKIQPGLGNQWTTIHLMPFVFPLNKPFNGELRLARLGNLLAEWRYIAETKPKVEVAVTHRLLLNGVKGYSVDLKSLKAKTKED